MIEFDECGGTWTVEDDDYAMNEDAIEAWGFCVDCSGLEVDREWMAEHA